MSWPGLSRGRLVGLVLVLVLVGAALAVGVHSDRGRADAAGSPAATGALSPALRRARDQARLPACPPGLGTDLPGLVLSCLADGSAVRVAAAPGRPTLVNLWGTWCGPCVAEVPDLVRFADRAGSRVGVVGVATEDTPESVYAFAKAFGVDYPLVRDDLGDVLHHYASSGQAVPKTLLVTADGRVAFVKVGPFTSLAQVEDAVATHLGVSL